MDFLLKMFVIVNILDCIVRYVVNEATQADQTKFCKQVFFHLQDLIYINKRIFIMNINRSLLSVIFDHCIKHGEGDCS